MDVRLLTCTPDFLRVIWCAARTCYSALSPLDLWEAEPPREDMLRLVHNIIRSGHLSVVEHCSMTFGVAGVSRTLLAQYTRHRIGVSISVQSQRHVRARGGEPGAMVFPHVVPPEVAALEEASDLFHKQLAAAQDTYERLVALGIKKEDARFVLPGGAATNFVTTVNLRSLLDLYQKRVAAPGVQWEIKNLIRTFAALVVEREPWLALYFGAAG